MKFKIDENLSREIAADLRAGGHDADTVDEEGLAGVDDAVLMASVQREGRVFLTGDKGIGNVTVYLPDQYAGLILFRPRTSGRGEMLHFVRHHLPYLLQQPLQGHLWVVTDTGIRVR